MKLLILLITLILITSGPQAARLPSRWRAEISIGKAQSNYQETQDSVLFENRDIDESSLYVKAIWQYLLVPPFIDLSLGVDHTGISISTPTQEAEQYSVTNLFANIGISLALYQDMLNLRFVTEGYYSQMNVENNEFGLTDLRGLILYPEIEFLPFGSRAFMTISPYIKFPIYSFEDRKKESVFGLRIRLPFSRGATRFPIYSYQKAIIFDVFYRDLQFTDSQEGYIPVDARLKQLVFTIGYNF